jgi:hypothetical protein
MPHLILTSVLLFALLAVVATAIGACFGIARGLMLDEADETPESETTRGGDGQSAGDGQIGLAEDFGIGLRHASNFAQDPGRPFSGSGSFHA